jgi:hypothetical protein
VIKTSSLVSHAGGGYDECQGMGTGKLIVKSKRSPHFIAGSVTCLPLPVRNDGLIADSLRFPRLLLLEGSSMVQVRRDRGVDRVEGK